MQKTHHQTVIQNIQQTLKFSNKKTNDLILKMGQRLYQMPDQRRCTGGKEACEELFNITCHYVGKYALKQQ